MLKTPLTGNRRYSYRLLARAALLCVAMFALARGAAQAQPPTLVNRLLILEADTIQGVPNGGLFQTWNDTSGHNIVFLAGNDAVTQPTWIANAFGAAPGVLMTNFSGVGSNVSLYGGNPTYLSSVTALSISVAFKTTDTGEFDALLSKCPNQDRGDGAIEFGVFAGLLRHAYGPADNLILLSENPVNDGAAHVVTYVYDPTAQSQTWFIDGQYVGSVTGETNPPGDTISNLYIGRMQNLSDPATHLVGNGPNTDMTIGAIYMDGATWTPAQQAAVEGYLGAKYGVTIYPPLSLTHGALSQGVTGNTQARLVWTTALNGAGGYTYQLYRSTQNGFTPSPATAVGWPISDLSELDTGLSAGGTYFYRIIVTDSAGAQSVGGQIALTTLPANIQNILFIGDSLTYNGLPDYILANLNASPFARQHGITYLALNDGRPGSSSWDWSMTGQYYAQSVQDGQDGQAVLISCMSGTNDAGASDPVATYESNMLSCAQGFSGALGVPIILHEPPYSTIRDEFNNPPLLPQYPAALDAIASDAASSISTPPSLGNASQGQRISSGSAYTILQGDRTLYAAIEAAPSLYLVPDGVHFTTAANLLAGMAQAQAILDAWAVLASDTSPLSLAPTLLAPAAGIARL